MRGCWDDWPTAHRILFTSKTTIKAAFHIFSDFREIIRVSISTVPWWPWLSFSRWILEGKCSMLQSALFLSLTSLMVSQPGDFLITFCIQVPRLSAKSWYHNITKVHYESLWKKAFLQINLNPSLLWRWKPLIPSYILLFSFCFVSRWLQFSDTYHLVFKRQTRRYQHIMSPQTWKIPTGQPQYMRSFCAEQRGALSNLNKFAMCNIKDNTWVLWPPNC